MYMNILIKRILLFKLLKKKVVYYLFPIYIFNQANWAVHEIIIK